MIWLYFNPQIILKSNQQLTGRIPYTSNTPIKASLFTASINPDSMPPPSPSKIFLEHYKSTWHFCEDLIYIISEIRMQYFLLLLLAISATAITQSCQSTPQCPINSYCILTTGMCACNPGYIGPCNITATPLNTSPVATNISNGQTLLFTINPIQLNVFLEFLFTICVTGQPQISITLALWGQTGNNTAYVPNNNNSLGNPTPATLYSGCQQFIAPYTSFGSQPNGQNQMLVLGITDNSQGPGVGLAVSVSQQIIAGMFIYYYILIAMVVVVVVVILIGVTVFIMRRRRRNISQGILPAQPRPAYNDIEYFQTYMPLFPAQRLGSQKHVCSICLQNLEPSEIVRQTPCKHNFHSTCIDSWCLKNLSCPVCRTDLTLQNLQQTQRNLNASRNSRVQQFVQQVEINREQIVSNQANSSKKEQRGESGQNGVGRNINFDEINYDIREHML